MQCNAPVNIIFCVSKSYETNFQCTISSLVIKTTWCTSSACIMFRRIRLINNNNRIPLKNTYHHQLKTKPGTNKKKKKNQKLQNIKTKIHTNSHYFFSHKISNPTLQKVNLQVRNLHTFVLEHSFIHSFIHQPSVLLKKGMKMLVLVIRLNIMILTYIWLLNIMSLTYIWLSNIMTLTYIWLELPSLIL